MFCNHNQVGRTRVNKVREGKKNPPKSRVIHRNDNYVQMKPRSDTVSYKPREKTIGQMKNNNTTGLDKLFQLQKDLFREGLNLKQYENYIQEKVNSDKHYYKNLSENDVTRLTENYRRKLKEKKDKYFETLENRTMKKKQIKNFKKKRGEMVYKRKQDIINELLKELKKTGALGISKGVNSLTITPDNWQDFKLLLFTGGRYLESHDRGWTIQYKKLVSPVMAHLFNKSANYEINPLVYSYE